MKRREFAALLVVGAVVVASPLALVAENYQKRCKRSGELIAKGDLEGAQNELDAALKKPPRDEKDRFMLGAALCELSENLQKAGDRGQAVADLREAVRLDQDEAYWHGALAKALYLEGNSEEGRKECSEAAQLSPDDSDLVGGCSLGARRVAPYKRTTPEGGNTTSPQPHTIQPVPLYKPDPPLFGQSSDSPLPGHSRFMARSECLW